MNVPFPRFQQSLIWVNERRGVRNGVIGLLAVLLVVAVYWPGLSGGYVLDDYVNLVGNARTQMEDLSPDQLLQAAFASDSGPLKRPIAMLSLSLERYFVGLDPFVMKATNVAIHVINALLIFVLIRALGRHYERTHDRPFIVSASAFALLMALGWAVAPINLTGVLYVIQRMESLASLFILVGLLAYVRGRLQLNDGQRRGLLWIWGGLIGAGGLGALAKESAVMLPVYAIVIEWLFFGFGQSRSSQRRAVYLLFAVVLVVPGILGGGDRLLGVIADPEFSGRPFDVYERLWTQARVLWHYIAWIAVPSPERLSLYHDGFAISRGPLRPWTTLPAAIGIGLLAASAVVLRYRFLWASFGILWFFVMHLLVSTVLSLELVFEHRNYLGSLGILTTLFALILDRRLRRVITLRRVTVIALVALYADQTWQRADVWGDPLQLAAYEATHHADSERAHYRLGMMAMRYSEGPDSEGFAMAESQFREAAELEGGSIGPWFGLILLHSRNGLDINPNWWDKMQDHLAQQPITANSINSLSTLVTAASNEQFSQHNDALRRTLDLAILQNPANPNLLTIKADFLLNVAGDADDAEALLKRAAEREPKNLVRLLNLIRIQIGLNKMQDARENLYRLQQFDSLGLYSEIAERLEDRIEANNRQGENP